MSGSRRGAKITLRHEHGSWRAGARRVLWARLCRREGQPVPTSRAAVTDVDIEPFLKADGPGKAHMAAAMARFPNLARMFAI